MQGKRKPVSLIRELVGTRAPLVAYSSSFIESYRARVGAMPSFESDVIHIHYDAISVAVAVSPYHSGLGTNALPVTGRLTTSAVAGEDAGRVGEVGPRNLKLSDSNGKWLGRQRRDALIRARRWLYKRAIIIQTRYKHQTDAISTHCKVSRQLGAKPHRCGTFRLRDSRDYSQPGRSG